MLALDKVRFVGEAVALVLADDPHVAEQAVQLITADYEALPAVYDEVEALTSSVIVHDELKPAGTFADLKHLSGRKNTNVTLDYQLRRGEVDAAFASADRVFEHTFRTQPVTHTTLEPFICLAELNEDTLTLHTTTQMPSFVRIEIARLLGWTENRVRVKVLHLGGGFAAKTYIRIEALAAVAALLARRPVRLLLTMEEQFYTVVAHASTFKIKSARRPRRPRHRAAVPSHLERRGLCRHRSAGGAEVRLHGGGALRDRQRQDRLDRGLYQLAGRRVAARLRHSEAVLGLREPHRHDRPRARHRPAAVPAEKSSCARAVRSPPARSCRKTPSRMCSNELARRMNWAGPFDRGRGPVKRGRGIAIGYKAAIAPTTSVAMLTINADGSCNLQISTTDMGQGSDTAMAQIAAEVLGTTIDRIKVTKPDTDITPFDMGTLGSRSTFHMGHAVKLAAEDARDKLQALGRVRRPAARQQLSVAGGFPAALQDAGRQCRRHGDVHPALYAARSRDRSHHRRHAVLDDRRQRRRARSRHRDRARSRLTKLITVADGGTLLNPKIAVTQLSGAAIMQIGYALFERMEMDHGQCTNASLADYKIPGMHDVPAMESVFVEATQANAPFGAKGVGESGSFAVAPAIANAIHDAVGVRLTDLPMTPEAVLTAICQAGNRRLGEA